MDDSGLRRWAGALRAMSTPVVATDDTARTFTDEMGHRRPVDRAFLAWCGRAGGEGADGARAGSGSARVDRDVELWEDVLRARGDRGRALAAIERVHVEGDGSIVARDPLAGVEVWTETELSALHALSWLALMARESGERAGWERVMRAAAWHVAHTQPDNATGHPWALHVFLWLERASPGAGGLLYAETLLHNCQVGLGRPDRFSAYVLRDCAQAIDAGLGPGVLAGE